jgi:YedE family putative selenium metabolism protein
MFSFRNLLGTKVGIIGTAAFIGGAAALLQKWGNPGNMGICMACFTRDISGAIGLHREGLCQYLRPEILGFVLGATLAAWVFREFRARGGAAPLLKFVLGFLAMIGALAFLGCPWRAFLRLAGGDGNAVVGILGLAAGIWIGALFFKGGYRLRPASPTSLWEAWLAPIIILAFLAVRLFDPPIPGQKASALLFYSAAGPGAAHAPLVISLAAGLAMGFAVQRSRFCSLAAFRDLFLFRYATQFLAVVALATTAFATNLMLGQFHPGFAHQPVAHSMGLWNFLGMAVAGLAFALAGGCPARLLALAGEGDGDAATFFLGMLVGAGASHDLGWAASSQGIGPAGKAAVVTAMIILLAIGFAMLEKPFKNLSNFLMSRFGNRLSAGNN